MLKFKLDRGHCNFPIGSTPRFETFSLNSCFFNVKFEFAAVLLVWSFWGGVWALGELITPVRPQIANFSTRHPDRLGK